MSQSKICNFCHTNVLLSKESWDLHHPSYSSLASSARSRCVFCGPLYRDVEQKLKLLEGFCRDKDVPLYRWLHEDVHKTENLLLGRGFATSFYRWSIRGLGRTRESKEMVAITFRAIPQQRPKEQDKIGGEDKHLIEGEIFDLPERVFYCFPETDLGKLLESADLGVSTNPEANDGLQIKRWVNKCNKEHKHCPARARQHKSGGFVPTRLLFVGAKGNTTPIRVVETKHNNIRGPYVTLSHCWGTSKDRKDTLLRKNKKELMSTGIPWNHLSRNFQQAIEVTRFLDIEYIWIDSLCIIQGPGSDFAEEGALMHKIYRNSYCNIAAADSKDSFGGLFRKREPWQVLPARFDASGRNKVFGRKSRVWRVVREDLWQEELLKASLYTRGWVFQERMLAPRIIHFAANQIFWDCAEMSACETLPNGLPLPLDYRTSADRHWRGRLQESGTSRLASVVSVSGANDDSIEEFWRAAVRNYTSCNLTNQDDKRIAIWGVAKLVRDNLGEEYGAGMWEDALEEQLAWRVADCGTTERPKELKTNPSWSWTSVKGAILLENRILSIPRAYTVKDHEGRALNFKIDNGNAVRPQLHRERSEDLKEEIAAMGKDLETVAEKRKKSLSRAPTIQLLHNKIRASQPAWIIDILLIIWHAMVRLYSSYSSAQPKQEQPRIGRYADRDLEPHLLGNTIPMQGHISHGILHWNKAASKWTIDLAQTCGSKVGDTIVDAFPDIKRDIDDEIVRFVILALSQHSEHHRSLPFTESAEEAWYSGIGIIIRPLDEDTGRYTRVGSLQIRHLNPKTWECLQDSGSIAGNEVDENGTKFFLE